MNHNINNIVIENLNRIRQEKIKTLIEEFNKMEQEPKRYHLDISTIETFDDIKNILRGLDLAIMDNSPYYSELKKYFPISYN